MGVRKRFFGGFEWGLDYIRVAYPSYIRLARIKDGEEGGLHP